jgi:hypothetical protein
VPHRSRHGSHGIEREALADRNLNDWLRARAQEIKPGGVIAFHCPIRMVASPPHQPAQSPSATTAASASFPPQPSSSSSIQGSPEMPLLALYDQQPPATPIPFLRANVPAEHPHRRTSRPGMWYHAFLPAVQRLVSLGEIRPHVAPFLLDVPYWPRSLAGLAESIAKQLDWEVLRPDESGVTHLPPLICLPTSGSGSKLEFEFTISRIQRGQISRKDGSIGPLMPVESPCSAAEVRPVFCPTR